MSFGITSPLTTIFTPPASCTSRWTYEGSFYNSISRGILIQDALGEHPNPNCFPPGWEGYGRAPSESVIYSPGACPVSYSTAANSFNGQQTTAVCCPSSFSYLVMYSSIDNVASSSAEFRGCISMYPTAAGYTTVLARVNNTDTTATSVTGPLTMWAQPISVAFKQADLALFTTTASSSTSSTSAPFAASTPTTTTASQTSSPTPTATTAPSTNTGLSGGAIAGIAIGAAAVLGILIGLAIFLTFRRRKERAAAATAAAGGEFSDKSPTGHAQPWNGDQVYAGHQLYDGTPQEMSTSKSVRKKDTPVEMTGERDPVELG